MEELRAVVFELRPGSLEAEGLATVLRKHVEVLRRVSGQAIDLRIGDVPRLPGAAAAQVLRIAQEALGNALRHSGAQAHQGASSTAACCSSKDDGQRVRRRRRARQAARADVDGRARDRAGRAR